MSTRYIIAVADSTERDLIAPPAGLKDVGFVFLRDSNTIQVYDPDAAAWVTIGTAVIAASIALTQNKLIMGDAGGLGAETSLATLLTSLVGVKGVAADYKLARGVHQQVAQSDTVVTGLTTVVAIVVSYRDAPTAKQQYVLATIGDQAGTPAAGSVLIKTLKSTLAVSDDFTDNINFNWIAVGT